MNLWKVVLVVVAVLGIAGWFGYYAAEAPARQPPLESGSDGSNEADGAGATLRGSAGSAAAVSGEPVPTAEPVNSTTPESARVAAARQQLAGLEVELERFELLINDIEARGEDPADHAIAVMPEFRPLMNALLDAQAELEAALAEQVSAPGAASDPVR